MAIQVLYEPRMAEECIFTEIGTCRNKKFETALLFISCITIIKILNWC